MTTVSNIFISYRRSDSGAFAGRLFDSLSDHFGKQHIFRDIDAITPGAEFANVIKDRISVCETLIAVIGNNWLAAQDGNGKRRLDDPHDYVKAEIRQALRSDKLVIPALIDGARMPKREELPRSIVKFASRNAIEISDAGFDDDVNRLIKAIDPNAVPVMIPLEQYEAALKRREQEIREELGSENETNWERLAALEKALAVVMERLQNPETSLARAKTELAGAAQALDRLKHDVQVPNLDQAKQALARGETASAEDLLTQTLAAGKEQAGEAAFQLGELARHRIDYLKAYECNLEAVRLQPRNPHYLSKAAEILYDLGRYGEAMPFLKQSLAIRKEMYGTMHPNVAQCLNHLAGVHLAQGEYAEAESLYKESLAMRKKFFGSEHPTVAESLNNLGQLYYEQGQYAEAEQLYQQALAIYEKSFGHQHSEVATVLNNLANLYQAQSLYAKAKPEYEEALTIDEKVLGPNHPGVATDLNNLGVCYFRQGDLAKPETLYQRALEIRQKSLGSQHPDLAGIYHNLARLYDARSQYADAEPLYMQALDILEKTLPPGHPALARVQENVLRHHRDAEHGSGRSAPPSAGEQR